MSSKTFALISKLFTAPILLLWGYNAFGQCGAPNLQTKTASASVQKCGFTFECATNHPPHYFLTSVLADSISCGSTTVSGTGSDATTAKTIYSSFHKMTQTTDRYTCQTTTSYEGRAKFSSDTVEYMGSITNSITDSWDGGAQSANSYGMNFVQSILINYGAFITNNTICTSTTSGDFGAGSLTTNNMSFSYLRKGLTGLSHEYTDNMLVQDLKLKIPPFPEAWNEGTGSAFFTRSDDYKSISGGKMIYRFYLCGNNNEKGVNYKIEWDEVKTYPDGTVPSLQHKSENFTGNGDPNGGYGKEHTVEMPAIPCTIKEGNAKLSIRSSTSAGS